MAISTEGTYQDFAYTGGVQSFTVPFSGLYKLECYGGQGGKGVYHSDLISNGGYSEGYKKLKKGQILYICVGGAGENASSPTDKETAGGYNGGGNGQTSYYQGGGGGGGATHIAFVDGTLASIGKTVFDTQGLIVAGGAGGSNRYNATTPAPSFGGSGGGTSGGNTARYGSTGSITTAYGGTQTNGYAFGRGAKYAGNCGGGGGGGYYGGKTATSSSGSASAGGGGSGWIGGVPSITYKGVTYSPSTSNGVNSGNGKARITFVKKGFPTIIYNGVTLEGINFNGTEVEEVVFNGVTLE